MAASGKAIFLCARESEPRERSVCPLVGSQSECPFLLFLLFLLKHHAMLVLFIALRPLQVTRCGRSREKVLHVEPQNQARQP